MWLQTGGISAEAFVGSDTIGIDDVRMRVTVAQFAPPVRSYLMQSASAGAFAARGPDFLKPEEAMQSIDPACTSPFRRQPRAGCAYAR